VIAGKKRDFLAYGIQLEFDDEALWEIAVRGEKEKTGARGLVSALEKVLLHFEKKLPSTNIKYLLVTKRTVEEPLTELRELVFTDALYSFQKEFLIQNGVVLEISNDAKEFLRQKFENEEDIFKFLSECFKDYSYGLKLVKAEKLNVTKEMLSHPAEYLNKLIKKSYKEKKD
jgi:hypothetical protein